MAASDAEMMTKRGHLAFVETLLAAVMTKTGHASEDQLRSEKSAV